MREEQERTMQQISATAAESLLRRVMPRTEEVTDTTITYRFENGEMITRLINRNGEIVWLEFSRE